MTTACLVLCQPGFESLLRRELEALGLAPAESGPGMCLASGDPAAACRSAFAHTVAMEAAEIRGERVNELAGGLLDFFLKSLAGERVEAAWPCVFGAPPETVGLGRRATSVEEAFLEALKKRLGRVARLAGGPVPRLGEARGLFVWFSDFGRMHAARSARFLGPSRMADDDLAPSRSYLKVEEAYGLLGVEPAAGETVCDLGAAPGGWSYSAAKRGARVVAVDNGPLKGGALNHPLIEHRREDAFGFAPPQGAPFDWLFCDMIEDPHKVLRSIVAPWVEQRRCRRFVVNLKFGRVDPVALASELRAPGHWLSQKVPAARIAHLYHDREEFTVVGTLPP
jgi:23S rRNA (cytidine2498-2'-O)-methyltransferase